MADDKPAQQEKLKQVLNLRELYHGRFTQDEIKTLLQEHDWNDGQVISFIQENEPATVRQSIQRLSENEIKEIQSDRNIARNLAEGIATQRRLFSCESCDRFWWRKVPERKLVSKCHRCHVKYEPVPVENEWGWAIFSCECGNEFSGHGQWQVGSECYKCGSEAFATEIRPPVYRRTRRTRSRHSCNAPDCDGTGNNVITTGGSRNDLTASNDSGHNMTGSENTGATGGGETIYNRGSGSREETNNGYLETGGHVVHVSPGRYQRGHSHGGPLVMNVCVSPESRQGKKKVIFASRRHISSGSTVDTFLEQDDLCSLDSYVSSLPVIQEQ
ncbi:shiftless antiviral inhibitor of ribosomal frameshifting protein homolog [Ylistrum balloti]|uniref:shiftless antiviral inhibitor of ribosomal frameshifting protein homolog n=1 Tax=Ylistrum balloti TaxID=509963 RepID=UPI002905919F|nr:shiftless antiviral inhibitor of ribosomal frameshifting protein homolog [Ylistrum balloti]